jgi:hypothetical protein
MSAKVQDAFKRLQQTWEKLQQAAKEQQGQG